MLYCPHYQLTAIYMNRVVHFEIHAKDREKIKKFYQDVFGWEMQQFGADMGNYTTIKTGDAVPKDMASIGINGGIAERRGDLPQEGAAINAYVCVIGVDDTDKMVEKVQAAGGSLALAAMDVPGVGRLAYCKDPEGNIFGMLKPDMSMPQI